MIPSTDDAWKAFSEQLDRVLELPETERAAWLDALAASEPAIAARIAEVLEMQAQAGFDEFLAGQPPRPDELPAATLTGRRVGPYEIERELGRGGMGSVWLARRIDGRYEGRVAVKFVHAAWIGHSGEQRFRVEGNLLGRLDHPNIARLIDAGVLDGSQPYLVLEYVEGEPIDVHCQRQGLSLEARITLFLDVLAAVGHAHSHLVIHRDIKPGNIFVTRNGAVKLLDFGIAKLLQDDAGGDLTRSSANALTPLYAAPEQLTGGSVTTSTDVYALGLVLYVLLTGTHPVRSGDGSTAGIVQRVLSTEYPRASAAGILPTIRRRALEGDLDNILAKATRKTAAERFATPEAFADDLKRFLAHEPVHARADSVTYRVGKFVRRHRGGVTGALLVTLALIGTTSFALWELSEARAERDIALSEVERAKGHNDLATYMLQDSERESSSDSNARRLGRAVDFVEHRYAGPKNVAANLLLELQNRYLEIADTKTALELHARAVELMKGFDDPFMTAEMACEEARNLALSGDSKGARTRLDEGLRVMKTLRIVSPGLRAGCATPAGLLAQTEGDFAGAIANQQLVVKAISAAGNADSFAWIPANHDLSRAYITAGDFGAAWRTESQVIELAKTQWSDKTSLLFALLSVASNSLRSGGQPVRSIQFIDDFVKERRQGDKDIDVPFYIPISRDQAAVAAGALDNRGPGSEIEKRLVENLKVAETANAKAFILGARSALMSVALQRADLSAAQAQWAELEPLEKSSLATAPRSLDAVRLLCLEARLELARSNVPRATQLLQQAASLIAERRQPLNPDTREVEVLLAQALLAARDAASAARHADQAVALARRSAVDPQSSSGVGEALWWRARAELSLGQADKAAASAREALPHLEMNLDAGSAMLQNARQLAGASRTGT